MQFTSAQEGPLSLKSVPSATHSQDRTSNQNEIVKRNEARMPPAEHGPKGLDQQEHTNDERLGMCRFHNRSSIRARSSNSVHKTSNMNMTRLELWLKGLVAAAVSGGAGGVLTGFAAVGIDPQHFNLQSGMGATFRIGAAASLINAVIGVAAYLQKSPLPSGD